MCERDIWESFSLSIFQDGKLVGSTFCGLSGCLKGNEILIYKNYHISGKSGKH